MNTFTATINPILLAEGLSEMEVYTKGDEIVTKAAADYILSTLDEKPSYQQRESDLDRLKTAIFGSDKWDDNLPTGAFIEMVQTTEQARAGALLRAERAEKARDGLREYNNDLLTRINSALALLDLNGDDILGFNDITHAIKHLRGEL